MLERTQTRSSVASVTYRSLTAALCAEMGALTAERKAFDDIDDMRQYGH